MSIFSGSACLLVCKEEDWREEMCNSHRRFQYFNRDNAKLRTAAIKSGCFACPLVAAIKPSTVWQNALRTTALQNQSDYEASKLCQSPDVCAVPVATAVGCPQRLPFALHARTHSKGWGAYTTMKFKQDRLRYSWTFRKFVTLPQIRTK